jgi:hypothetical protein
VIALLVAAPDAAPLREAEPYALELEAEPEEVTLGDPILVRISVTHDPRDVYALSGFDPAPLAVPQGAVPRRVQREEAPGGRVRTVFEMTLVDTSTLEPRLPDFTLAVTGPQGPRQLSIRGRPLKFRSLVQEENQGAPDRAHHGSKPPVPVIVRSLLWLWVVLGVAGLVLGVVLMRRAARRRALRPASIAPPETYDELALRRIHELRETAPWKRGEARAAVFLVSEIVRGYLGERLRFNALELTSEEFLAELHRRRLLGLHLDQLIDEVRWEDLVKFAKLEPSGEECLRALERAESMIRHTRLRPAVAA